MMSASNWRGLWKASLVTGVLLWPVAAVADDAASFGEALTGGKPILDVRLRYEHVGQSGIRRDANALTARARFGYQTGSFKGLSALAEGEVVKALGHERFNDTVDGRTAYPVVADPDAFELNRLWLNYDGPVQTSLKVGRQRILLDNQRFVGAVGFRQNEQTFDAVMVTNKSLPRTTAKYIYIWNVNRIFGDDSRAGNFDSESHLLNVGHGLELGGWRIGTLTGYGYWLDLEDDLPIGSTRTIGLRLAGKYQLSEPNGLDLLYAAEFAHQWDGPDNPGDYGLSYYLIEPGLRWRSLTVKAGYEVLEGNGTSAFQTPLATLHAFQGVTDVFLTTPARGIEDIYVKAEYKLPDLWPDAWPEIGWSFSAAYHHFSAEDVSMDYGDEWGVKLAFRIHKRYSLSAEFASYDSSGFATDRDKLWITFGYAY